MSIPHTRGDGPLWFTVKRDYDEYSPHAWGWTAITTLTNGDDTVFPTRVGMDRANVTGTALKA